MCMLIEPCCWKYVITSYSYIIYIHIIIILSICSRAELCWKTLHRKGVSSDITYFKIFVWFRLQIKKSFFPGRAVQCCNWEASELWSLYPGSSPGQPWSEIEGSCPVGLLWAGWPLERGPSNWCFGESEKVLLLLLMAMSLSLSTCFTETLQ